ncbi:peptide ABC transporter ATP-binding protein [Paenibacillus albidus]|uniref:Peptide ABC transporter ATP-binding protein n=1 Tax=Paenibacillus albidus TaxID=2041023 RepID=A0A917CPN3_9BACL|nr:nickel import ATP-binding protein NikE [Paenibacillus albidus]GGF94926.1 peptide ABC transporter ATP-binding protein [Paenibacillus albidus]
MLQVREVSHSYGNRNWLDRSGSRPVLENISLTMDKGSCYGLLGTSGAGKSTLGKIILGIEKPSKGEVWFEGKNLYHSSRKLLKEWRRDLQVVFQDCYSAVNPLMTAAQIIGEPLRNFERYSPKELQRRIGILLEQVGLRPEDERKYPHQFSGGQLQRVNIARAIALKPKLIVLDESVSSLDMVHQTQILSLLADLRTHYGLSYLFITHDIRAATAICDHIAVMDQGSLVYQGGDRESLIQCAHPAVKQLVSSILPEHPSERIVLN